jgi:hypothetical protein
MEGFTLPPVLIHKIYLLSELLYGIRQGISGPGEKFFKHLCLLSPAPPVCACLPQAGQGGGEIFGRICLINYYYSDFFSSFP